GVVRVARFGDEREVWRQGPAIRCARCIVILEGSENGVGLQRGTLEHFAVVVRPVRDLVRPRGCERLHRFLIEFRPAGLEQVAEANARQPVTRGTNLLVDLKAALKLRGIVLSGKPAETPALAFDVDGIASRERRRRGGHSGESRERYEKKSVLCRLHRLS